MVPRNPSTLFAGYIKPYSIAALVICSGCLSHDIKLFTLMPSPSTGITFANNITYTRQMNPYTNHGFYNGAGVAVGDINNDGLPDLFFCSNQGENKLYLNKGNFKFDDITNEAGLNVQGLWCTGATFVDINGDGLLDLYVCKSFDYQVGWRSNQLFINNGDLTFSEKSGVYGLANQGISTQATFFDYDNDGDLDCYLLNNSNRPVGDRYDLIKDQRIRRDSLGGNKLYRNDGDHFTDVTNQAGIYSSNIGFGLGVTVADINKDGWPDIYISNDYFERDYLYINNHDGTFTESLEKYLREISLFSMGADIADINNDGYPEIFVTDMLPRDESRIKTKTSFENWNKYQADLKSGYYQQFLRNVLQLNRGPVYINDTVHYYFSEIGRYAGVEASDWSWGALIADLNNDGWKDIFVANGMYKDVTDQDFIQLLGQSNTHITNIKQAIDSLSSTPISKFAFCNNGDLTFTDKAKEWGLDQPGFSNGSAYVDLDNDGDLDLVTNNVNGEASVYRNNCEKIYPENKFLKVNLEGIGKNRFAFGAKVTVYHDGTLNYQEEIPSRGFQSCVDARLNFGLGKTNKIDSVKVEWADGKKSVLKNVTPNQIITINEDAAPQKTQGNNIDNPVKKIFTPIDDNDGINFIHKENYYSDFDEQRLVFLMHSTEGPRIAKGDVNGDGLDDVYIGGAKQQPGALFVQTKNGKFIKATEPSFEKDSLYEDEGCLFFDADGDRDLDLFVCSGGNEVGADTKFLADRLYLNDGKGNFTRSTNLPMKKINENSSCADAADFDGDGDLDLFVGIQMIPDKYGYPCSGYVLENNGKGIFKDVTMQVAPDLKNVGMITDAKWFDYDKDGRPDLIIAGEYMPLKIFHNEGGAIKELTQTGFTNSNGWWNRIKVCDVNDDGYPDIVAGNYGLNSRIRATVEKPASMYVNDFDGNGITDQILCTYNDSIQYPMILRHDLVAVLPSLKKKFLLYKNYSEKKIDEIFSPEQLKSALKLNVYQMQTCIFMNNRRGGFTLSPLPSDAQFSPVYGISVDDFDGDGKKDILLGGNFYQCKPEIGINDASYGTLLKGDGKGNFVVVPMSATNLCITGAVRDICEIKNGNKKFVLIAKNNAPLQVLRY